MYRNIVVPLDGSATAEQVLPYVKDLVQNRAVTVHLICVAPLAPPGAAPTAPLRMYPFVMTYNDLEAHAKDRDRIEDELRNYLKGVTLGLVGGSVTAKIEVRFGEPAEEIIAFEQDIRADLVAMCTHGRTGLARWAYGSVAEKVLRHASCPVLLVRARRE